MSMWDLEADGGMMGMGMMGGRWGMDGWDAETWRWGRFVETPDTSSLITRATLKSSLPQEASSTRPDCHIVTM